MKKTNEYEITPKQRDELNFRSFMNSLSKNIPENENFLSGKVNVIEYLISAYSKTPIKNIDNLKKLCMKISSDFCILNQFAQSLPNLEELYILEGSRLNTVSEIGTSFRNLRVLSLSHCKVKELEGMICFPNLKYLNISHNLIEDLFELDYLENLIHVNLNTNYVSQASELDYLLSNQKLEFLDIRNNPVIGEVEEIESKFRHLKFFNVDGEFPQFQEKIKGKIGLPKVQSQDDSEVFYSPNVKKLGEVEHYRFSRSFVSKFEKIKLMRLKKDYGILTNEDLYNAQQNNVKINIDTNTIKIKID